MSTKDQASSGSNPAASGSQDASLDPNDSAPKAEDKVSYETYQKLLGEKKKRDLELTEFKKREKDREEQELKQKEDYKKLLALRDEELEKTRSELAQSKSTLENGAKLQAFLDALDGQVEQQYWGLIDLNQVVLNPETGLPEDVSVKKAALEFKTKYGLVIKQAGSNKMPHDAPKGSGSVGLSYEEWLKLPAKDMRARLKDVIKT